MAVINIEKEMPESCSMRGYRMVCVVFGEGWTDANIRYSLGVHSRLANCPLKSVDGLIEFIKESKAFRCMGVAKQVFIELKDLFRIIKEYFGEVE